MFWNLIFKLHFNCHTEEKFSKCYQNTIGSDLAIHRIQCLTICNTRSQLLETSTINFTTTQGNHIFVWRNRTWRSLQRQNIILDECQILVTITYNCHTRLMYTKCKTFYHICLSLTVRKYMSCTSSCNLTIMRFQIRRWFPPLKCHKKFEEPNTKVLYNDMPTHNINF